VPYRQRTAPHQLRLVPPDQVRGLKPPYPLPRGEEEFRAETQSSAPRHPVLDTGLGFLDVPEKSQAPHQACPEHVEGCGATGLIKKWEYRPRKSFASSRPSREISTVADFTRRSRRSEDARSRTGKNVRATQAALLLQHSVPGIQSLSHGERVAKSWQLAAYAQLGEGLCPIDSAQPLTNSG
jgi:hypothetical protein